MTRRTEDHSTTVATQVAESYVSALAASGSPLVADETGRQSRYAGSFDLSLTIMSDLGADLRPLPTGAVPPRLKDRLSGHDPTRDDFAAILAAVPEYLGCAEHPLADATGRTPHEVGQQAIHRLLPMLYNAHRQILSRTADSLPHLTVTMAMAKQHQLTRAETAILIGLGETVSNRELAESLHISDNTLKRHINRIGSKLNTSGRNGIMRRAFELGIVALVPLTAVGTTNLLDLLS